MLQDVSGSGCLGDPSRSYVIGRLFSPSPESLVPVLPTSRHQQLIFPVVARICQISLTFCGPWSPHHHKSLPLCTQLKTSTVSVMLHCVTNQQKKSTPLLFTKPQIPEYMLQSRRPLLVSSLTTSAQTYVDVCYCELIALSFNGDQLLLLKWFFHLQLFTLICFKTENFQISNETGQNQGNQT